MKETLDDVKVQDFKLNCIQLDEKVEIRLQHKATKRIWQKQILCAEVSSVYVLGSFKHCW